MRYPDTRRSISLLVGTTGELDSKPGMNSAASPHKAVTSLWHTTALLLDLTSSLPASSCTIRKYGCMYSLHICMRYVGNTLSLCVKYVLREVMLSLYCATSGRVPNGVVLEPRHRPLLAV